MPADGNVVAREQFWIDELKSADNSLGYNVAPIAGSVLGYRHTEESRRKQSKAALKRCESPEERKRLIEQGRKQFGTPEFRKAQSKRVKKRFESPEERLQQSLRGKKQFESPEARKAMSEAKLKVLQIA